MPSRVLETLHFGVQVCLLGTVVFQLLRQLIEALLTFDDLLFESLMALNLLLCCPMLELEWFQRLDGKVLLGFQVPNRLQLFDLRGLSVA